MKVACIANSGEKLSQKHFGVGYSTSSRFDLALQEEYGVYGMALWRGLLSYLVVGEGQRPAWYPADLFEVLERTLPTSWQFTFFGHDEATWVNAVWGYEELMSADHYDQLSDMEPQALEIFWKRKLELDESS